MTTEQKKASDMEFKLMSTDCIREVVTAIHDAVAKHHGSDVAKSAKVSADYAAVALFALCDMGLHKLPLDERQKQFAQVAENLRVMASVCATDHVDGLILGLRGTT